jgi:hypothetical protein
VTLAEFAYAVYVLSFSISKSQKLFVFSIPFEYTYTKDFQIPKALGMGNTGIVDLWGRIDRHGYCPGEKIALSGKYWNRPSNNYLFSQLFRYCPSLKL